MDLCYKIPASAHVQEILWRKVVPSKQIPEGSAARSGMFGSVGDISSVIFHEFKQIFLLKRINNPFLGKLERAG